MASGYFLFHNNKKVAIAGHSPSSLFEKLIRFEKKTALLYAVGILLYLPLNIYMKYFSHISIGVLVRDILADGTFYHLWYFPGVMLGAFIAYLLYRYCKMWCALGIAALLYLMGLLGDSYYGAIQTIPWLQTCYKWFFSFFIYTRNGLFFAPLFILLGGYAGRICPKNQIICKAGTTLCMILLLLEALLLHSMEWQRHDSMYFFLIPCMVMLFGTFLPVKSSYPLLHNLALCLYLLYPFAIVVVHGAAKLLHLQALMTKNSVIFYCLSVLCTCAVALPVSYLIGSRKEAEK